MFKADKVIVHGMFNAALILFLACHFFWLKKCFWLIWGGDLYYENMGEPLYKQWIKFPFRKFVIRNMGNFVTYLKGDYEYAIKHFGIKGKMFSYFMYPSNIFKGNLIGNEHFGEAKNIMIGNSATISNRHLDAFDKLM